MVQTVTNDKTTLSDNSGKVGRVGCVTHSKNDGFLLSDETSDELFEFFMNFSIPETKTTSSSARSELGKLSTYGLSTLLRTFSKSEIVIRTKIKTSLDVSSKPFGVSDSNEEKEEKRMKSVVPLDSGLPMLLLRQVTYLMFSNMSQPVRSMMSTQAPGVEHRGRFKQSLILP
jgi:hypothetical protein